METIINKVAQSKLVNINLEEYYPQGKRQQMDLKEWLYEGLILKEKEFRQNLKNHNWSAYQDSYVALHSSTDAIVPGWAYLLVTAHLAPFAKTIVQGSLDDLNNVLFIEAINSINFSSYKDKAVIINGCSNKPIPENAYTLLIQKLMPVAKSVFYGEACSSVPIFKKNVLQPKK